MIYTDMTKKAIRLIFEAHACIAQTKNDENAKWN